MCNCQIQACVTHTGVATVCGWHMALLFFRMLYSRLPRYVLELWNKWPPRSVPSATLQLVMRRHSSMTRLDV